MTSYKRREFYCPISNFGQNQEPTDCLDAIAQNMDQVHWIKLAAIFKTNKMLNFQTFREILKSRSLALTCLMD